MTASKSARETAEPSVRGGPSPALSEGSENGISGSSASNRADTPTCEAEETVEEFVARQAAFIRRQDGEIAALRAEVERLSKESINNFIVAQTVTGERDSARAEVERLRGLLLRYRVRGNSYAWISAVKKIQAEAREALRKEGK